VLVGAQHVGDHESGGPVEEVAHPSRPVASSVGAPTGLDSGEPRCRGQTVAIAKSANCRYSDCQFSITAWPKLEEVR
jgi:hypothetical protein